MDGQLARDLTLCLRGTAFLQGRLQGKGEVERTHWTFESTREVAFQLMPRGEWKWQTVAHSVNAWFDMLKNQDVQRVLLRVPAPAPVTAGDSGISVLGTVNGVETDWWQAKTRLIAKPAQTWRDVPQETRVWSVTYRSIGHNTQVPINVNDPLPTFREARIQLAEVVGLLRDLTDEMEMDVWSGRFATALNQFTNAYPESGYEDELLALKAPIEVRQLVAAAQTAWCFGSDIETPIMVQTQQDAAVRDRYEDALRTLYVCLKQALEVAVEVATNTPPHVE